VQGVKMIDFFD